MFNDDIQARSENDGAQYARRKQNKNAAVIELEHIEADEQHRKDFDAEKLQQLANSLRDHGQQQPIRVRYDDNRKKYIIIAGERRYRAAKLAGLKSLECTIEKQQLTEGELLRSQAIENLLRDDLKPVEQAKLFSDLMASESLSMRGLADYLHVSPALVSQRMSLLDLSPEDQRLVDSGAMTVRDAEAKAKESRSSTTRKRKARPKKEIKITLQELSGSVTLKMRRNISEELIVAAMEDVIAQYRGTRRAA